MAKFTDLQFEPHENMPYFGTHARVFFPNGYGASVITGQHAYTGAANPYEVAVLCGDNESYSLTYNTPITDDVIGHLNSDGVEALLNQIEQLPSIS